MHMRPAVALPPFHRVNCPLCVDMHVPRIYVTPAAFTPPIIDVAYERDPFSELTRTITGEPRAQPAACASLQHLRHRAACQLQKPAFHYIIILLVIIDLVVVLVDLLLAQLSSPCLTDAEMRRYNTSEQRDSCLLEHSPSLVRADLFLFYLSVLLLSCFVMEVLLSLCAFGWRYFKHPLYSLDASIVCASFVMELYFHYGNIGRAGRAAAAIVVLRLWKIIRAVHAVAHSITLKNRVLTRKLQEANRHAEHTVQKQQIRTHYLSNMLAVLGKLPATEQIDNYVNRVWRHRYPVT